MLLHISVFHNHHQGATICDLLKLKVLNNVFYLTINTNKFSEAHIVAP
jgi:hypothetical protein